jgi:hypothetical protein
VRERCRLRAIFRPPTFSVATRTLTFGAKIMMWVVVLILALRSRAINSLSAPPESCSELLADFQLARDRELDLIRSSHEEAIRKLQSEIEGLRRACACTAPNKSNESSAPTGAAALPPAAAGPEAMDGESVSGESVSTTPTRSETRQTLMMAKAPDRRLLRSTSPALNCSKAELRSVSESSGAGAQAIFMQLMETNVLCGICILQALTGQVIVTLLDAGRYLFSCLHQEENRCDQETGLSRIEPILPLASVDDRGSFVRMLELVEAGACIPPHLSGTRRGMCCHALQTVPTAFSRQSSTCTAWTSSARSCEYCTTTRFCLAHACRSLRRCWRAHNGRRWLLR